MHPQCANSLDVVHSHFDALIFERYLMVLHVCYSNEEFDAYNYNDIIDVADNLVERLISIKKHSSHYNSAMKKMQEHVWEGQRLSEDLFYLNTIEEGICEHVEILNTVLETCLDCCTVLRVTLELKKNFRDFMTKVQKLIKRIKEEKDLFSFETNKYFEDGMFLSRSQHGFGFSTITPSVRRR